MRSRHAPRRADATDDLAALHGVADRHQQSTQVMVGGGEPFTVLHVDRDAAVEEFSDEYDNAAIGRAHRRASPTGDVEARMTAAPHAVHAATRSEHARHPTGTRSNERR